MANDSATRTPPSKDGAAASGSDTDRLRADILLTTARPAKRQFVEAFALMTLLPMLLIAYLISVVYTGGQVDPLLAAAYTCVGVSIAWLGFLLGRQVLARLVGQLVDVTVQLKQQQLVRSASVANIAYELRSPLAAIQISLKNLADGILGPLADPQRKTLRDCHEGIARLTRLAAELVDISDLGSGKPTLQREVLELQQLLRDVIRRYQPTMDAHNLAVITKLPERPVMFLGDRARLVQAFGALLDHALRWSWEGSEVDVELRPVLEGWQLMVSHDIAADRSDFARTIETFRRLGTGAEGELGLGLHLAREIVDMHHGRFWVEGEPGKNTQLIFVLPSLERQQRGHATPAEAAPA